MVKLSGLLNQLKPTRVLVLGDFMVDSYTIGNIRRISPEAPVSVLNVQKEEKRPGGAGNVVLNLLSLGASVTIMGRVGDDLAGEQLYEILQKEGADATLLVTQTDYQTPIKNRLIADAQQILRVDFETFKFLDLSLEETLISHLGALVQNIDVIAISDYAKGFLSPNLLERVIAKAREYKVPVIVDPKGNDFTKYKGATLIKPNLSEAYGSTKLPLDTPLEEVAAVLLEQTEAEMLVVTRSEKGISLFDFQGKISHFPVYSKEVKDVTGAGDTVLAMLAVALGSKLDVTYGIELANIAAGLAIEKLGCARITLEQVAERLLEYDVENKIFDAEHLFALQKTLEGKKITLLAINSSLGMTTELFRALRALSARTPQEKLIVFVKDSQPCKEFISLLASLGEVSFILLKSDRLKDLCDAIEPSQAFLLEGAELIFLEDTKVLFAEPISV